MHQNFVKKLISSSTAQASTCSHMKSSQTRNKSYDKSKNDISKESDGKKKKRIQS